MSVVYLTQQKTENMTTQMTIREIRRVLFKTDKYTVIGPDERTNEDSRNLLYGMSNQEEIMNVIDNGTYLLIWN